MNCRFIHRLALALALMLAAGSALADTSNKWRLQFSGAAESPGEIVLAVREPEAFAALVSAAREALDAA